MTQNEELLKKINDSIKEHIPSQVGEELQKLLAKGKADAEEVKSLSIANENNRKTINELNDTISQYKKLDERNSQLEIREKAAEELERKIQIEKLTYQLAAEKESKEFSKSVALGLVRNVEYRRSLFDNTTEPDGKDQYGNTVYSNKSQNSTEKNEAN